MGAMFGGFAGSFFAARQGFISPESFTFVESAMILAIVVLGGMGSISGAAIAAAILTILPEALRRPPSVMSPMLAGVLIGAAVLILLFARRRVRGLAALAIAVALYAAVRQAARAAGIQLSEYRMVLYSLALILMMILRPEGLFGVRELWNAWRIHPLRPRRDRAEGGPSGTAGKVPVQ
jgi:ABC-type branched-subunit amino acid transport system permease subunit